MWPSDHAASKTKKDTQILPYGWNGLVPARFIGKLVRPVGSTCQGLRLLSQDNSNKLNAGTQRHVVSFRDAKISVLLPNVACLRHPTTAFTLETDFPGVGCTLNNETSYSGFGNSNKAPKCPVKCESSLADFRQILGTYRNTLIFKCSAVWPFLWYFA